MRCPRLPCHTASLELADASARDAEFDYLVDSVLACHEEMNRSDRARLATRRRRVWDAVVNLAEAQDHLACSKNLMLHRP